MFVKDKDQDGYNYQLSIWRNTQRSEIIMAHPFSVELSRYFDQFRFLSLRVFNILYASLLTVLYEPLKFFSILSAQSIFTRH